MTVNGSMTQRTIDRIRGIIGTGQLPASGKLPSERELVRICQVSRTTVRNALQTMRQNGEIVIRSGRTGGSYISPQNPHWNLYARVQITNSSQTGHRLIGHPTGLPTGIPEAVEQQGAISVTHVEYVRISTPEESVCEQLQIGKAHKVVEVRRTRTVEEATISYEIAFLPCDLFPHLAEHDFTESVYSIITAEYGKRIGRVHEALTVVGVSAHEAPTFNIPVGSPIIFSESTAYDEQGTPLEYSQDYFRADRVRIVVDNTFPDTRA